MVDSLVFSKELRVLFIGQENHQYLAQVLLIIVYNFALDLFIDSGDAPVDELLLGSELGCIFWVQFKHLIQDLKCVVDSVVLFLRGFLQFVDDDNQLVDQFLLHQLPEDLGERAFVELEFDHF